MRSLAKFTAYSMIVALAAALMVSCEDSALLAPTDSVFTVTASPEMVVIDEPGGEIAGQSLISAQIFDSANFPMGGVEITFTTTSGTLSDPDDALATAPILKETDAQGVATVLLTITLDDEDEVTVTARSGTVTQTAVVTMTVTLENQLPEAFIAADPQNTQVFNRSVLFDGRSSADPDGDSITCYRWTITTDLATAPPTLVYQGHGKSVVLESYDDEQILDVELQVSDDPGWAVFCDECDGELPSVCGASGSAFGNPEYLLGYEIVCDRFDPEANAGPDLTRTLTGAQTEITVSLDGYNSEGGDSGITEYRWNCNGDIQLGVEVQCTFPEGTYYPTLTVTNGCNETDGDTAVVTVLPAEQP